MPDAAGSIRIGNAGDLRDFARRSPPQEMRDTRVNGGAAMQQSIREQDGYAELSDVLGQKYLNNFITDWLVDPATHSKLRVSRWFFETRVLCDLFTRPVTVSTRRTISAKQQCIREFSDYVCAPDYDRANAPQHAAIRSRLVIPLSPTQSALRCPIGYLPVQKNALVSRKQIAALLEGAILDLIEAPADPMRARATGNEVLDFHLQHGHFARPVSGSWRLDATDVKIRR